MFRKTPSTELLIEERPKHTFDKKYKVVVNVKSTPSYTEMLDWVNSNSNGLVDVRFNDNGVVTDLAFTDPDDALVFKIKYSI